MRSIGLHLRMGSSFFDMVDKAVALELPIFQCFLRESGVGPLLNFSASERARFVTLRRKKFKELYVHVSYQANLCKPEGIFVLEKELALARKLEFTHVIVHPGSGKWCKDKGAAMEVLINALNRIDDNGLTIVLENSAHGDFSVGGDLQDFVFIRERLIKPEKIKFCIDTAHAYVYGYDVASEHGQEQFIAFLQDTVGFENIALIHLNDTLQGLGKRIDQHHMVGHGALGVAALQRFALHPRMQLVPLLLELPICSQTEELQAYQLVCSWHITQHMKGEAVCYQ